jgi:tetratricopeptide (TPR) repeat protein
VIATVGLAMVRRELKEYGEAERLLKKALDAEPSHVLARATLAGVYEDTRQLAKAIEEWKKLVDLPLAGEQGNARRAEYWAHLGFDYGELERHEESADAFARARELAGKDERYDAFYVQSLLGAERTKEARSSIEDALARHPDSMRLKILETRVLAESGEEKRALQKALAMSDRAPDDEMLTLAVVELYQREKDYASAERFLGERLERNPDSVELLFQLGAVLERQGKFDDAEAKFRRVLDLEPDSAPTLNYLGYMLADRGVQLDQSLEYVKQALAADPHNGAYLDSLGWVYFKMGNLDLAEDNLLKALASLRLTGVVYDHLGDLYFRKGNLERAVQYWQKALDQEDDELEKDAVARKIEEATSPR